MCKTECIHMKRAVTRRRVETPKNHLQRRIDVSDDLLKQLEELEKRRKETWLAKGRGTPNGCSVAMTVIS
jgi:hypothetical protein